MLWPPPRERMESENAVSPRVSLVVALGFLVTQHGWDWYRFLGHQSPRILITAWFRQQWTSCQMTECPSPQAVRFLFYCSSTWQVVNCHDESPTIRRRPCHSLLYNQWMAKWTNGRCLTVNRRQLFTLFFLRPNFKRTRRRRTKRTGKWAIMALRSRREKIAEKKKRKTWRLER